MVCMGNANTMEIVTLKMPKNHCEENPSELGTRKGAKRLLWSCDCGGHIKR